MYTAILRCGTVLAYETRNFVPNEGDVVTLSPTRFCAVCRATGGHQVALGTSLLPRPRPRSQHELVDFLRSRPVTTVHVLRRRRFTLRLIAEAAADGILEVDFRAGRIALRRTEPPSTVSIGQPA
ncbi:hypothetical protein O2W15_23895 [Modestobacter sp. VKM Ac-2979]|uniref:hypothetical protein n=1 Tax=unclassified Modestobacter TaxID=2643866 RepID=UPI0022ABA54C|nr:MULTISPECIES: hypothetical protein [unclassified Modestobacter]MCZ2814485.1 hypothetical protein [Modestobacter sp. VKM Ac-2979]MCZ2844811.1 hypothetical protein [Modestobacter sp. VKM Ac-2980]